MLETKDCYTVKKKEDKKLSEMKTTIIANSTKSSINSVPSSPQLLYRPNLTSQKFKISTLHNNSSAASSSTSSLEVCEISLLSNSSSTFDSSEDSATSPPIPLTPIDIEQSTSREELSNDELSSLFTWSPVCSDTKGTPKKVCFLPINQTQYKEAARTQARAEECARKRELMHLASVSTNCISAVSRQRRYVRRASSLRHTYMHLSSEESDSEFAARRSSLGARRANLSRYARRGNKGKR